MVCDEFPKVPRVRKQLGLNRPAASLYTPDMHACLSQGRSLEIRSGTCQVLDKERDDIAL